MGFVAPSSSIIHFVVFVVFVVFFNTDTAPLLANGQAQ